MGFQNLSRYQFVGTLAALMVIGIVFVFSGVWVDQSRYFTILMMFLIMGYILYNTFRPLDEDLNTNIT